LLRNPEFKSESTPRFPHSPGYRLILNNILFPAAQKEELKT